MDQRVIKSRIENERHWRGHVARLRSHTGTAASYCRAEGLSIPAMGYWQRKLGSGSQHSGVLARTPAFIPVEVVTATLPANRALPDPRWVAELILHLGGGLR